MSEHSNRVHRVFVNSKFRRDKNQPTSNFTIYLEPALSNITKFKVNSCSIPITNFTFQGYSEEERTFELFDSEGVTGSKWTVIFDDNRVYTLDDIVTDIQRVVDFQTLLVTKFGSASVLQFQNQTDVVMQITKFPKKLATLSTPQNLNPQSSSFDTRNDSIIANFEVAHTNYGVKSLQLDYEINGIETTRIFNIPDDAYSPSTVEGYLNSTFTAFSGLTFAVTGSGLGPYTITGTPSTTSVYDRGYRLTARLATSDYDSNTFPQIAKLVYTETLNTVVCSYEMEVKGEYNGLALESALNENFGVVGRTVQERIENQWYLEGETINVRYTNVNNIGITSRTIRLQAFDAFDNVTTTGKINITNNGNIGISVDGSGPAGQQATFSTNVDYSKVQTNVAYGHGYNLTEDVFKITNGLTTPLTFTSTARFTNTYEYGEQKTVTFHHNHAYDIIELVFYLNQEIGSGAGYGLTFSSSGNRISVANGNTLVTNYGAVNFSYNDVLGQTSNQLNAPIGQTTAFPQDTDLKNHINPFTTPTLNLSTDNEVCYLALPSLVSSSRCGLGHRSFVKTIYNLGNKNYGNYMTFESSGDDYLTTTNQSISEVQVQIHGEGHEIIDLNGLDVRCELEFR
jgi:hypothetical protein